MPRNTSISLGNTSQASSKAKITALQEALVMGEESGEPQPFDNEAFKARMRAEHGEKGRRLTDTSNAKRSLERGSR